MIHVWCIYLHWGHLWGKCRYIYHTWIIWEITMLKPGKKDIVDRRLHLDRITVPILKGRDQFDSCWAISKWPSLRCSWPKHTKTTHDPEKWELNLGENGVVDAEMGCSTSDFHIQLHTHLMVETHRQLLHPTSGGLLIMSIYPAWCHQSHSWIGPQKNQNRTEWSL